MVSLEAQQVSNLIFFLQDRQGLVRAESSSQDERQHLSPTYNCFATIESFLWLHLGVQLNYFSRPAARRATYEYFHVFLAAYEYVLKNNLDQRFSPPLQRILASEFGGRSELFSQYEGIGEATDRSVALFQGSLILSNEFARDLATETLVDSMAFKRVREWDDAIEELDRRLSRFEVRSPNSLDLRQALASPILTIVQYMETFRQLFTDSQGVAPSAAASEVSVVTLVKERLKDVQRWRLDFREIPIFDRFIEVLDLAIAVLQTTDDEPSFFQDRVGFVRAVRSLMIDWGAPPLSSHARA